MEAACALLLLHGIDKDTDVAIQYSHKGSKALKYYEGSFLKRPKTYKKGLYGIVKFTDKTTRCIELPYEELGTTWKILGVSSSRNK